jgi:cobyrinic acid a,c-diamide synthase
MIVTREILASKLLAYINRQATLAELVDWAERVMQEGDFAEEDYETVRNIVARLGVADVEGFKLSWDEIVEILEQLGYKVRVEVTGGHIN